MQLLEVVQIAAPAVGHMTFNSDFEWCCRADIKPGASNDAGHRIAIRDAISTDMRSPAVVPVIPVVAWGPGQRDAIYLHVHPHIRFRQRLSGRAGVFEVGRNALTVQVT